MLEDPQIQKLMKQVAAGIFPAGDLLEVHSEPTSDEIGQDALRITLVLTDKVAKAMTGKQLSRMLTEIHDSLLNLGDERFPHLRFATPTDRGVEEDED